MTLQYVNEEVNRSQHRKNEEKYNNQHTKEMTERRIESNEIKWNEMESTIVGRFGGFGMRNSNCIHLLLMLYTVSTGDKQLIQQYMNIER